MLDILWKLALSKYNNSYCQWVNDTSVPLLTKIQLTKSNSAADTCTYTNTLIKRIWQFSPLKISLAREWFANIKEIEWIHGNSEVKSLTNHWPIVSIVNIINPIECFRVVLVLTREHNSLNRINSLVLSQSILVTAIYRLEFSKTAWFVGTQAGWNANTKWTFYFCSF